MTTERAKRITDRVEEIVRATQGAPADVIGPALVIALTELAKADGQGLSELIEEVSSHYGAATGKLWRPA